MIRRASTHDIESIMDIVSDAQLALRELGIDQWQDGYPSHESIATDIMHGVGYVSCADNKIMGYAAIVLTGEAAYDQIGESWRAGDSYIVVHRLCVANYARRHGVAIDLIHHAAQMAREVGLSAFRIDTHKGNIRMMSMMSKLGFEHVGTIRYESGEREAFELDLASSNII